MRFGTEELVVWDLLMSLKMHSSLGWSKPIRGSGKPLAIWVWWRAERQHLMVWSLKPSSAEKVAKELSKVSLWGKGARENWWQNLCSFWWRRHSATEKNSAELLAPARGWPALMEVK